MSGGGHGHEEHGHGHGHGNGAAHAAHVDLEQPLLDKAADDHGHDHGGGEACCGGHGGGDGGHGGHGGHEDHGHAHSGSGHGGHGGHGGHEDHGHAHGGGGGGGGCHGHSHGSADHGKSDEDILALQRAVVLATFFMTVELVGGYYANSLAIMTDAAHMLSDVGGFIISLLGLHWAQKPDTEEFTFGYKQAEVIGAFLSILIVWALTAMLLVQAAERFENPEAIDARMMCIIAVIGLFVNLALMKVLGHNHSHGHGEEGGHDAAERESIAIKAAVAHVIGDIVQSLGVCLAAALIWFQPFDVGFTDNGVSKWVYADPCCTVLFGIMVLKTTKGTITYALNSFMVKTPSHIDQEAFYQALVNIPNVSGVHDLHVWSMGSSEVICTAHVMIKRFATNEQQTAVLEACIKAADNVDIGHKTFQIEIEDLFDPALETYGGLHQNPMANPMAPVPLSRAKSAPAPLSGHNGHDDTHDHGGHDHGGGHECDGHDHGGGDGGHAGHGGHDGGHGGHGH